MSIEWEQIYDNYLKKTAEVGKDPLRSFVKYLEDAKQGDYDSIVIEVRGNEKQNFHRRGEDTDVIVMATVLEEFASRITHLILPYNNISGTGAQALARLLQEAPEVRVIDLQHNNIDSLGARYIFRAVQNCSELSKVSLNANPIGNEGGLAAAELLQMSESLVQLDVGDAELGTDALIAIASVLNVNNHTLKALNLDNPRTFSLQEETAYHISRLLRSNLGLQELSLSKHRLRDYGMSTLCDFLFENRRIRVLQLRCNEISVGGAEALGGLLASPECQLQLVDLASNRVADRGCKAIAQALRLNRTLQELDLTNNSIGDKGLVALADALHSNNTLQTLRLFGNDFAQPSARAFHVLLNNRHRYYRWVTDIKTYVVDDLTHVAKVEVEEPFS
eukprot:GILI01017971.1.p1 GENE.GILI01017971.1~~GILI01017971.1.p1  ORF type:complete len:391 (+),score=122.70 GILI01017971.1:75-1247(+)